MYGRSLVPRKRHQSGDCESQEFLHENESEVEDGAGFDLAIL